MNLINRRQLLKNGTLAASVALAPGLAAAVKSGPVTQYSLKARQGQGYFLGAPFPSTPLWCYNQRIPGPEIRARQGDRLRILVTNDLAQDTTVHCHGIRLPIEMDGVPGLTQPPIKPDGTYVYEFDLPDAGTYWYHPHFNSPEQIGRGLYGALIIEEADPIMVDREWTLVLDDWRLDDNFQIRGGFENRHDRTHAGRIGNSLTVNGRINPKIPVVSGQRLRLRLINASNARTFSMDFSSLGCRIIAVDGHPVTPHRPEGGMITLAAAGRVDLITDMMADPGSEFVVEDNNYRQQHRLMTFLYSSDSPIRTAPLDRAIELKSNTMPEPDMANAVFHEVALEGGAMGGMRGAMIKGEYQSIRQLVRNGMVWAMNGEVGIDHTVPPLISLVLGQTCVMNIKNETAFDHPMHLHGHAFRVLKRNDKPTRFKPWQDTVMVARNESVEIAFVADNPGDWMFHCHVLEHQVSGMSSIIRVS